MDEEETIWMKKKLSCLLQTFTSFREGFQTRDWISHLSRIGFINNDIPENNNNNKTGMRAVCSAFRFKTIVTYFEMWLKRSVHDSK